MSMFSDHRLRFFGSIKLAVPLLSLIVGILIWATFYESQVGSATVQQEIYKSPWFGALMFLLAINLGISTLSRYPWRNPRKIGFALTHWGLILIIAGAAAVIHLGSEGLLLLRTDGGSNNQIRVEGDLLEVIDSEQHLQQTSLLIKSDGSISPQTFAGLSVLEYSNNTVKTFNFTEDAKVENPGVKLSLTSSRMGQTLQQWLAIAPTSYSNVFLGPATLEILSVENQEQLEQQLSPPEDTATSPWGKLTISTETDQKIVDIANSLSETIPLGDLTITLVDFWSDFRLDSNNTPISASSTFNNPAVRLEIRGHEGVEQWFVFGANFAPIRSQISGKPLEGIDIDYDIPPQQPQNYFRVIVTENQELFYAAQSSQGFKSGTLEIGQAVTPGWADFQITLETFLTHAQPQRQIVPVSNPNQQGTPALLVQTETGSPTWLPWGEPTTLQDSERERYAAFSPKVLKLPFAIKLEDFIVDRNEGSNSVAMWTSQIRIDDPHRGAVFHRQVWMNHPTWYQGWKIAQASWNPGDLKQSTLQVKREPLWVTSLTWGGSALVVMGIGTMFYGPILTKKWKQRSQGVDLTPQQNLDLSS